MKRLRVLGLALFAVFAFGAVAASAALAEEAQWLVNGAVLAAKQNAITEGEIELINYSAPGLAEILNILKCSGIFVGTIGPKGEEEITGVLSLTEAAIGEDKNGLSGTGLLCEVTFEAEALADCKKGANEAELFPANLPWKMKLALITETDYIVTFPPQSGYEVVCKSLLGINGENLCEGGVVEALLENGVEHVIGKFLAPLLGDEDLANCTLTGEHTGEIGTTLTGETYAVEGELTLLPTAVSEA